MTYYDRIIARYTTQSHDDALVARNEECKEWHARGRKPKTKGLEYYKQAHKICVNHRKEFSIKEIAKHYGTYYSLIERLVNEEYNRVPQWKAKQIAKSDGKPVKLNIEKEWDEYRKVQKFLQDEVKRAPKMIDVARKYGIDYSRFQKVIRDELKNPHETVIQKMREYI